MSVWLLDKVRLVQASDHNLYHPLFILILLKHAVGAALRNNPFAPFVPCHRIIASDHSIGGFFGEWGENSGTGKQCNRKLKMLAKEGVGFTEQGYLVGNAIIWRG